MSADHTDGRLNLQRLKISHVAPGRGANRAGLEPGDVIESYNGIDILTNDDLTAALQGPPGVGRIVVHRSGGLMSFDITELPLGVTTQPIEFDPQLYDPDVPVETVKALQRSREVEAVLVTTTPSVDGYRVARIVDVVSAECVFGMNIFKDIMAAFSDTFGGRSGASQSALRDARKTCMYELKYEAHQLGANAVIGIGLDYSEFSGQGKSMLFLVASGTAVVLEKIE